MMKAMASDSLGTRIRRARERKRWTQQQLADALAVSVRTVNDWENDRTQPRNSIGALEQVLGERLDGEPRLRPVDDDLRSKVADVLGDGTPAYRRVIGLLEGTLTEPPPNGAGAGQRRAR